MVWRWWEMSGTHLSGPLNVYRAACVVTGIFHKLYVTGFCLMWATAVDSTCTHTRPCTHAPAQHVAQMCILLQHSHCLLHSEECRVLGKDQINHLEGETEKRWQRKNIYFLPPSNAMRKCQGNHFTGNNRKVQHKIIKRHSLGPPLPRTQGSSSAAF